MKWIDSLLDQVTIYRLLLYYLIGLEIVAVGLAMLGILHYQPIDIVFAAFYIVAVCWVTNKVFARIFKAPTNVESPYITALILALITSPTHDLHGFLFMTGVGVLAMASKFLFAIKGRHLFNPAAIAVVLTNYGAGDAASWWVGTASMLPWVLIGGILLARRIRRSGTVVWFVGVALVATVAYGLVDGTSPVTLIQQEIFNSALFFFAFVMLTEPLTSPTTRNKRAWYGALVGVMFPPQFNILGMFASPEFALIIGNLFAYIAGPRAKTRLHFKGRRRLSRDSMDFTFKPERPFAYQPGQYMELTFQHPHTDSRGARRYFTLSSSPTEQDIRLGIKFYEPGSSYKRALLGITPNTPIIAGQLGGDFTLPKDTAKKLVFIAGGIGITPFRSMIKYLLDRDERREITLLYAAKTTDDHVYRDVFDKAATKLGIHVIYITTSGKTKRARYEQLIAKHVPDYRDCTFYISGPHAMVTDTEHVLETMGVSFVRIKKDFFSGYA
jgi:ferredoxin-NADP reductase/Na+-translocating ferredoxin:NAD+ oxidoreductase RnfD subunit